MLKNAMVAGASILTAQVFQQVVSLGPNCRAKYQIQRVFGKHIAKRGVFDWQTTPHPAFSLYLGRDFRGMFERSDLTVVGGVVKNTRYGTSHPHEFPLTIAEGQIDEFYGEARRRHDRLCATTKAALGNGLSTLFVLGAGVPESTIAAIRRHLALAAPNKRYLILETPNDDEPDWRGTASIWDAHLAAFRVGPPLQARAAYQLYRVGRNLRHLLPKAFRRKPNGIL